MCKNSPPICYTFFAIDDVIVTSVNTDTSMMGISTEVKYLNRSLWENKKCGAKWLLKLFPNKNWSLDGLKALMQKMTTQVLLFDVLGNGRPRIVHTVLVLSLVIFLISTFSPPRLHISYFLAKNWSSIDLIKDLISANSYH